MYFEWHTLGFVFCLFQYVFIFSEIKGHICTLFFSFWCYSLLFSSLIHPTALWVCWSGSFPRFFCPPDPSLCIIKFLHTSGSLLCWWGPSPTQDAWACSSPPFLLLHYSLVPSPNGAPAPHQIGHAVHGPQSPFSQSHGTTGSTMYLEGSRNGAFTLEKCERSTKQWYFIALIFCANFLQSHELQSFYSSCRTPDHLPLLNK